MDEGRGCVVAVLIWLLAVIVTIGWATLGGTGGEPSPSPTSLLPSIKVDEQAWAEFRTWQVLGGLCSDGWRSPSIGRQGACSHHGGVSNLVAYVDLQGVQHVCLAEAVMLMMERPVCDQW